MSLPTEENKVSDDLDFSQQVCQVTERFSNAFKIAQEKNRDRIAREKLYINSRVQALFKAVQEEIIRRQDEITDLITRNETCAIGYIPITIRANKGDNLSEIYNLFGDTMKKSGHICGLLYVTCRPETDDNGVIYIVTFRI